MSAVTPCHVPLTVTSDDSHLLKWTWTPRKQIQRDRFREDRRSDPFFLIWCKVPVWFVFRTSFASTISVRPAGHAKVPAEVQEDSRVLRVFRVCT